MILILAPSTDPHAATVAQELTRLGATYRIVDSSRLSRDGRIEFRAGERNESAWTCIDGHKIPLSEVVTVWHRRRFRPAEPLLSSPDDMAFLRREWTEFFSGLFSSLDAFFINDPLRQEAATKPHQLRLAKALGLRIPDTLITNDPEAAAGFIEKHHGRVVHKTLSAPKHRLLCTTPWDPSHAVLLNELVLAPTIFQETVTNCRELRITVIGQEVFAAEFRPPDGLIDGRIDLNVPYTEHRLPDAVRVALLALTRAFGLVYATIDLKLTDAGEYVFLELNPQGQFLYVEILTGMPLSRALAGALLRGADCASAPAPRVS